MVGQIVEKGTAVPEFQIGDRVVRWGRADDCRARDRIDLSSDDAYQVVAEQTSSSLYEGRGGNRMIIGGFHAIFDCVGIMSKYLC